MSDLSQLDVFFSVQTFNEEQLRNKTVVISDVLRATSTIVTAIANGAEKIIPVGDMGEASKLSQNVDSDNFLLCGEKDGVKIEGYDLGNSPLEYTSEAIRGKSLIFNTTNGTKAIKKSMSADEMYIASFHNLDAVVDALRNTANEIVIVCSGWKGRLSLEDLLLAGNIIFKLVDGRLKQDARDSAKVAFTIFEKFGNDLESVIMNSNHAARLKGLVVDTQDISYCCKVNTTDVLPVLKEGIITNRHVEKT